MVLLSGQTRDVNQPAVLQMATIPPRPSTHMSSSQTSTSRSRFGDGMSRPCSVNDFQANGRDD